MRSFSKRLIAPLVAVAALVGTGAALADANGRSGFESAPFGQPRTAPHDDGWRRTADGWERIDRWGEYASIYPGAAEPYVGSSNAASNHLAFGPGGRLDFHPAALALLQVTVLVWIATFARDSRTVSAEQ